MTSDITMAISSMCKIEDCYYCPRGVHHPNVLAIYNFAEGTYGRAGIDVCTARWASSRVGDHTEGEICGRHATAQIGDLTLCSHHATRLRDWAYDLVRREEQERISAENRERRERRWDPDGPSVVYYLRRADGLIKIGVSTRLHERKLALQRDHGSLDLLVKHWGDRRTERETHERFANDRITGEWFRPSPALLRWIERVKRNQNSRDLHLVDDREAVA